MPHPVPRPTRQGAGHEAGAARCSGEPARYPFSMARCASFPRLRCRAVVLGVLAGLLAGAGAQAKPPGGTLVPVVYPKGGCQSGWLEVQVYDASSQSWRPHPDHPRIRTGACFREPSDILLTDLRVRCIDPRGRRSPSAWVQGTDLRAVSRPGSCKPGGSGRTSPAAGTR